MEPQEAVRLVRKLAQVMEAAHAQGIIHRDLKPANIMLDLEAGPIVMDFGLARREDREESLRTRAGQQLGTPAYMPLEQFQGRVESIGPRSDVYSLGVILFELLTGRRPYEGNAFEIHMKLLRSAPPAPSSIRPGLDTVLDRICQKAMAREVEDRFGSMSEFDQALKGITDQETGKASRIRSPEEVSPPPSRGSRPVPLVSTHSSAAPLHRGSSKTSRGGNRSRRGRGTCRSGSWPWGVFWSCSMGWSSGSGVQKDLGPRRNRRQYMERPEGSGPERILRQYQYHRRHGPGADRAGRVHDGLAGFGQGRRGRRETAPPGADHTTVLPGEVRGDAGRIRGDDGRQSQLLQGEAEKPR